MPYHDLFIAPSATDYLRIFLYGLRLDVAVAAYLTIIPGLILLAGQWYEGKALRRCWNGYFGIAAFLYSLAVISNAALYGYWGFPLDDTPLLYVSTSPKDAMASMTALQIILYLFFVLLLGTGIYAVIMKGAKWHFPVGNHRSNLGPLYTSLILTVLIAALILPIRGGLGTGTNHTGSVYFTTDNRMNHAAVNPVFSFAESVIHHQEIGSRYRFMSDEEATAIFETMTHTPLRTTAVERRWNIILITLESFSDSVMHIPGVTPCLNELAATELYFPNFYANSFRTDRALVSIHSGLPAQPTMSIMDMPRKSGSLPSIAGVLAENGYSTTFYYGGDINYSNMRSYFMGTGFQQIVSDEDFPKSFQTSKWGVADGPVFNRMMSDIIADNSGRPFFRSIMTESSHEPFDVPDYSRITTSPELNAFAYADECLGRFIKQLRELPCWNNTLVVIVSDHLGAFPHHVDNYQTWRYHLPLVLTGGAMEPIRAEVSKFRDAVGSQTDIAATLLGMLGIEHSRFIYSRDLLDPEAPHFAFFTFPDAVGIITAEGSMIYDITSNSISSQDTSRADSLARCSKAFLQKLYDDLDAR